MDAPRSQSSSDAALLQCSGDDPAAFGVFYRRYERLVLGWSVRRLGDVEAAADLVAETFAAAWLSRETFAPRDDTEGSAAPWLLGIARNKLRLAARRRRIERTARERLGVERIALSGDRVQQIEALFSDAELWLASLPAGQREAVRGHVLDDEDYASLAARLNIEESAARQRVSRGLTGLRALLRSQGGEP